MKGQRAGWLAVLLMLSACGPAVTAPPAGSPPGPTVVIPVNAATASPPPGGQTIMPAPTLPATAVPLETLSTAELHLRLDPLGGTAPGCQLPCYNGLVPGESDLAGVLAFYARLGIGPTDLMPGDYEAALDGTGHLRAWLNKTSDVLEAEAMGLAPPLVDVALDTDRAQSVTVGWNYLPPYLTPLRVLEDLGMPVQLDLALDFSEQPPGYALLFVYPELQTGFAYYGAALADESLLSVCPVPEQVTLTFLGIAEAGQPVLGGLGESELFLSLADTLGLSAPALAETLRRGDCLTVPAEAWEQWQQEGD